MRLRIKLAAWFIQQENGATAGAKIGAHHQQSLVEHRFQVGAGEDELRGLLKDSHIADAGITRAHKWFP